MSLKKLTLALAIALAFSVGAIAAETTVGGTMFMEYGVYNLSKVDGADGGAGPEYEGELTNRFSLNRMYVTAKSKINDVWSVKVTMDAKADTTNGINYMYLKSAAVKAQVAPFLAISAGLVDMPEYALVHSPNGMRWLEKPVLDRAGDYNGDVGFGATSSDLGVKASMSFAKMIFVDLAFTTGESYKDIVEQDEDKAITLAVHAKLIEKLIVGAYGKIWLGSPVDSGSFWYLGATVAWKDKFYKAGVNWVMKDFADQGLTGGLGTFGEDHGLTNIFEVYANVNLAGAINVPILVMARATMGLNKSLSDISAGGVDDGNGISGMDFYIGVGYKFNENAQVALMYRGTLKDEYVYMHPDADEGGALESDITLNAEVKF